MAVEKLVKSYVKTKVKAFITKKILELELTEKGKKGIEKMQILQENFWNKAKDFVKKEKERDITWLPDVVEHLGEDVLETTIEALRETTDIRKMSQEIFDIEKSENVAIF